MLSKKPGRDTLAAEILGVTAHGVWLLTDDAEYFLSHKHYPWFKGARLEDIFLVKKTGRNHLHWPALDVDLEISSLAHPEKYPLVSAG